MPPEQRAPLASERHVYQLRDGSLLGEVSLGPLEPAGCAVTTWRPDGPVPGLYARWGCDEEAVAPVLAALLRAVTDADRDEKHRP